MYERATASGKINALCREYDRDDIGDFLDDWAKGKGMDFTHSVPDEYVDEIIEILRKETKAA